MDPGAKALVVFVGIGIMVMRLLVSRAGAVEDLVVIESVNNEMDHQH